MTSGIWNGDLKTSGSGADGYAGADALCQAAAGSGSVTGPLAATWKALLWTNDSTADGEGYIDTAGNFIAFASDSNGNLVGRGNPVMTPINYDENGSAITSNFDVWTGADWRDPLPSFTNCNNWTDGSGSETGFVGLSNSAQFWASDLAMGQSRGCDSTKRLYCVQQ